MRYRDIMIENTLPPTDLVQAAKLMRRQAWQEDGAMDVCRAMRDAGYLDPAAYNDHTPADTTSPEFMAKFVQWSKDEVEAMFDQLKQLFKADTLWIWREITAPEDWKPDPTEHPGKYWSWDKDAAEAHWGGGNDDVKWLLSAKVTFEQINWVDTLAQNATPYYADEKEITLWPNSPVKIESYQQRK